MLKKTSDKQLQPAKLNAPVKFTSPERLKLTLQNYRIENKALKSQIGEMQVELESRSLPVSENLNKDLISIMSKSDREKLPPFLKFFWEEQQKYLRTTIKSQIRYHPAIIKYCLSIAAKSSAAYEQLKLDEKDGSGILLLPSQRTLRKYRNYITPQQGFNPDVINDLRDKTKSFSEPEQFVSIVVDEMKV